MTDGGYIGYDHIGTKDDPKLEKNNLDKFAIPF